MIAENRGSVRREADRRLQSLRGTPSRRKRSDANSWLTTACMVTSAANRRFVLAHVVDTRFQSLAK
jgi:hypothetical protein